MLSSPTQKTMPAYDSGPLVAWLLIMALLVAVMVVIGGITRLTGSGLSMTEWRPPWEPCPR